MAVRTAPPRVVLVAAALLLLVQPVRPQVCAPGGACDGVCSSTCCTLFATMNQECRQEVAAHVLTPWAPCTETCLGTLEALLRQSASGVSCELEWETTLATMPAYITEAFPTGQHVLYEEFVDKCQDQRRDRACTPHPHAPPLAPPPRACSTPRGAAVRLSPSHSCSFSACRQGICRPTWPRTPCTSRHRMTT